MRWAGLFQVAILLWPLGLGGAWGHDMSYLAGLPAREQAAGTSRDCGIGNHPVLNLSMGGVCFGATPATGWGNGNHNRNDLLGNPAGSEDPQHITAGDTALLDVWDGSFPGGIPALYCQNLNQDEDLLCGGKVLGEGEAGSTDPLCSQTHVEGVANCTLRSEPYVEFCDSITIRGGLVWPATVTTRLPGGSTTGASLAFGATWADPAYAPDNWAINAHVWVFVASPPGGNPAVSNACKGTGWGMGGNVTHT